MKMLRTELRFILAVLRAIPWMLTERLWLATRSWHAPQDVGEARPYCLRCRSTAPCGEFMRASEGVYEARSKVASIFDAA